jgi:hypothetical protein
LGDVVGAVLDGVENAVDTLEKAVGEVVKTVFGIKFG